MNKSIFYPPTWDNVDKAPSMDAPDAPEVVTPTPGIERALEQVDEDEGVEEDACS